MPIVIDCEQGTPEWYAARAGIPTASEFEAIIATKKNGEKTAAYKALMMRLAGERITGEIAEPVSSVAIRRGHEMEPVVRDAYSLITDEQPQLIGFVLADDKRKGFSPDAFIGENGILEIKTKKPEFVIECIYDGEFPEDHKAQCQGGLWISEREWVDIMVYWPGIPPFIKRSCRDEAYIKHLSREMDRFNDELDRMVEKVINYNSYEVMEAA
ncbi:lambda exonuclease family protein [Bartonella sp. LJL80]